MIYHIYHMMIIYKKNPDFQSLDHNITMQRYHHFIDRRQKLISSLKNIRNEIIKDKNDSSESFINDNMITNYYNNIFRNKKTKNDSLNNLNKTFHIFKNISLKKSISMNKLIEQNKSLMILNEEKKFHRKKQRQIIKIKREIDFLLNRTS